MVVNWCGMGVGWCGVGCMYMWGSAGFCAGVR